MRTFLVLLAALAAAATASPLGAKSTVYIHSNDTMKLELRSGTRLFGQPDSVHALEFQFSNDGLGGHFDVRGEGSDGFNGNMKDRRFYLGRGMQKTITVSNLIVPQRPEDTKLMYTVVVERDLTGIMSKREAPPQNPNYENDNDRQDGSYGGSGTYSGPGGSGSYGGSGSNGGNTRPDLPSVASDPTYRTEIELTVEFTVASEITDEGKAETELTYGAKSDSETCPVKPEDSNCDMYMWWVRVEVEDKKSGLWGFEVEPMGAATQNDEVFFRYQNFPVGTTTEQEVAAAASCCVEGMLIKVIDVLGNVVEVEAENGGKGTPMSSSLKWGLIGGGIALLVIIIVVIFVVMRKKGYTGVSTE